MISWNMEEDRWEEDLVYDQAKHRAFHNDLNPGSDLALRLFPLTSPTMALQHGSVPMLIIRHMFMALSLSFGIIESLIKQNSSLTNGLLSPNTHRIGGQHKLRHSPTGIPSSPLSGPTGGLLYIPIKLTTTQVYFLRLIALLSGLITCRLTLLSSTSAASTRGLHRCRTRGMPVMMWNDGQCLHHHFKLIIYSPSE